MILAVIFLSLLLCLLTACSRQGNSPAETGATIATEDSRATEFNSSSDATTEGNTLMDEGNGTDTENNTDGTNAMESLKDDLFETSSDNNNTENREGIFEGSSEDTIESQTTSEYIPG
jgi:hypothetical protein